MPELLSISSADYHGDTSRISKSGLDLIRKSPLHYWAKHLAPNRVEDSPTEALILGTHIHAAVLEPDRFGLEYIVSPKFDKRTNIGKQGFAEFQAEHAAKQIVDRETWDQLIAIQDAVRSHPGAAVLLGGEGHVEATIHAVCSYTGAQTKVRPDRLTDGCRVIVDLKSTEDASPAAFGKSAANFRYPMQGAYYIDQMMNAGFDRPETFVFIAVEKKPPFAIGIYYLDDASISLGRAHYRRDLETYVAALKAGRWGGYDIRPQVLQIPRWAFTSND